MKLQYPDIFSLIMPSCRYRDQLSRPLADVRNIQNLFGCKWPFYNKTNMHILQDTLTSQFSEAQGSSAHGIF